MRPVRTTYQASREPEPRGRPAPAYRPGRRSRREQGRKTARAIRNAVLANLIAAVAGVLGRMSLERAASIGAALGALAHRVLRRERVRVLDHLSIALPEVSRDERREIARETFRNAGRSFAELSQWQRIQRDDFISIEGREFVDRALATGRGLLAVTGHIGNWELLAAWIVRLGYPLSVVARNVNDERFDALVSGFRARVGVRTIIRRNDASTLRVALRRLRSGDILALLVDQDTRGPGVFVPFFGRKARTSPGAAIIALRTRAPVVSAFIERRPHGHHIRIEPLLGFDDSSYERVTVEDLTARFSTAIEAQIRRSPTEWVWWHRRWRRQQETGPDPTSARSIPRLPLR